MSSSTGNGNGTAERRARSLPLQAASRVTGLVSSVMDLHVRIALQEADREKRRLIGGAVLLVGGLATLLLALITAELALVLWFHLALGWGWIQAVLVQAGINLLLTGLLLRVGGLMTKGPYLPETMAGLTKTTRALVGR
ncbi:MAG: phage holin family protein [Synechococcaceae bacterium WB8_1B_136]|nr:phage holin family protein [Synechococcaceae bacterium WB8_1B_136]